MDNQISIRKPNKKDADQIFEIFKKTWLDVYPNYELDITYDDILKKFSYRQKKILGIKKMIDSINEYNIAFIAEYKNEVVGYSYSSTSNGIGLLEMIYVLPEYQGKGIGSMLLKNLLNFHYDKEYIYLTVVSYNKSAINFYKGVGFDIVPNSESTHKIIEDKYLPTIDMKKSLKN